MVLCSIGLLFTEVYYLLPGCCGFMLCLCFCLLVDSMLFVLLSGVVDLWFVTLFGIWLLCVGGFGVGWWFVVLIVVCALHEFLGVWFAG